MKRALTPALRLFFFLSLLLQAGIAKANITIEIQPGTETVAVGEHVVLGAIVVTTGGELITGYQWYVSATSGGPYTPTVQSSSLILDNVQVTNSAYYYCTVFYQSGGNKSLASQPIQLTVDVHAKVLTQPVGGNREPGSNVVFSIMAAGTPPLFFQWRHDGVFLSDDARITGSGGTNLSIQNILLADAGNYDIVVGNAYGSVTSHVATLNVAYILPTIVSPTNASGKQGHAFNFGEVATGTPPMTFGADGLPDGLSVNYTNGAISGIPSVYGVFNVTLYATNPAATSATNFTLTLADDLPVITSATTGSGKQGFPVPYTITATNDPAWFDAGPLPLGMNVNNSNGVISGIPLVNGAFPITLTVTNLYGTTNQTWTLTLASGAPLITSALTKTGKQGTSFSYTIKATNNPGTYSATPLPNGLTIDPVSGIISGIPLLFGTFPVTIGNVNPFGSDSQTLNITLSTGAPAITSSLAASGQEETPFSYTIKANNTPTTFWAADLPVGVTVNTNNGAITGTPLYEGDYSVPIYAANAWGVGSNTLQLTITNLVITNLAIANVLPNFAVPYLLECRFSLRDSDDPLTSRAVVAPPSDMIVTAFENGVPVSPSETGVILEPASSKVLKGYLVLDFTASVASIPANGDADHNGISDAVDAEIASAQDFVNQQPPGSQIGVYEFHRDDEVPQQVIGLTKNKQLLTSAIGGIWTNYVQGFPAASRAWDALGLAVAGLGPTNSDETHYVVFMSDGQDDSSTNTLDNVLTAATNGNVQIFTVGFGDEMDTNTLQNISATTLGRFYDAGTNLAALALSFAEIGKDLSSQYTLRWATLKRSATQFKPTFQISYQGLTAQSPADPPPFVSGTNTSYMTNMTGDITTNMDLLYTTNFVIPLYKPTTYAGNVLGGFLRLVTDADVNPQEVTLRATYVPRYIRQLNVHYRANWPVTLSLNVTNTGGLLDGWSLTQTDDGTNGHWALLSCADTNNLALSIPFATFGNLLTFSFPDPINASNAFSLFAIDNTIYTNTSGTNFYGFNLTNAVQFINVMSNPPPYGTPIPWLMSYGFTNNFDVAELVSTNGNGLPVWQDYIAGLNPTNANSTFDTAINPAQGPPQITFDTAVGRTYRIEWSTGLSGPWTILRDGIAGTGVPITFTDFRNLSQTTGMFYRVAVEGP